MQDITSLAHTKWRCQYHIVFAPKYRRKNSIWSGSGCLYEKAIKKNADIITISIATTFLLEKVWMRTVSFFEHDKPFKTFLIKHNAKVG